jgi:hypothetical protein
VSYASINVEADHLLAFAFLYCFACRQCGMAIFAFTPIACKRQKAARNHSNGFLV